MAARRSRTTKQQGGARVRLRGRGDPRAHARGPRRSPGSARRAEHGGRSIPISSTGMFRSAHSLKASGRACSASRPIETSPITSRTSWTACGSGRVAPERPRWSCSRRPWRSSPRCSSGVGADDSTTPERGAAIEDLIRRIDLAVQRRAGEPGRRPRGARPRSLAAARAHRVRGAPAAREPAPRPPHRPGRGELRDPRLRGRACPSSRGAVRENGEVLSTLPSPGDAPESQIRFSLLVARPMSTWRRISSRLDFSETRVRRVAGPASDPAGARWSWRAPPRSEAEVEAARRAPGRPGVRGARVAPLDQRHGARRHPQARRADEPGGRAGDPARRDRELIANRLSHDGATARAGGRARPKVHKILERKLKELQAGVLDVRMVPAAPGLREALPRRAAPAPRSRQGGRRSSSAGADTELDKLIVEQLVDPADARGAQRLRPRHRVASRARAAGKPPHGRIFIERLPARQPRRDRGRATTVAASTSTPAREGRSSAGTRGAGRRPHARRRPSTWSSRPASRRGTR